MENSNILSGRKHVHMVGIGGVSMSGLAEILHHLGYKVTGSDKTASKYTARLESMGIEVFYGHSEQNIQGADLLVHSAAIAKDNPERTAALSLGIPDIDRATLLGHIMKQYRYSMAIAGTHGKTTTTSMASMIMLEAKVDPTVHIGGTLDTINGNTFIGSSDYFITEACEYVESF